jgi:hypothetical protein
MRAGPHAGGMRIYQRTAAALLVGVLAALASLAVSGAARSAPSAGKTAPLLVNSGLQIKNKNSGKCVEPENRTPNALIRQHTCVRGPVQYWQLDYVSGGYYRIRNNHNANQCLDLQVNSQEEVVWGTLTQQFYCNPAYTSELWFVQPVNGGYVQLVTYIYGLCLDVQSRSSSDGALLQVWGCKSTESAQLFQLV